MDYENKIVVTRIEGRRDKCSGKSCKRDQLYGEEWKPDFYWVNMIQYIQILIYNLPFRFHLKPIQCYKLVLLNFFKKKIP